MYKINKFHPTIFIAFIILLAAGCQKGDLSTNNNVANGNATISPSLLLNHITFAMYKGGGVMEGVTGNVSEEPWGVISHYNQFYLSNYAYYQGSNAYNWSNSATHYDDMLKYVVLMESQAASQYPLTPGTNIYAGLAKFFRAYLSVWLAQRVGDIPMSQAGNASILQPAFETQKNVFIKSLNLLDTANTIIGNIITSNTNANTVVDATGDIYGLTYLQWQKIVNTYKLRVLISLSKRAVDNADMNIPTQFATIVNNPASYPILSANSDNMVFKYTSVNAYPVASSAYSANGNICQTYLNLTTAYKDPRTFMAATPAPAQIKVGKSVSDFTAYVGADPNLALSQLSANSTNWALTQTGGYSFANNRYYNKANLTGASVEPYILIGYPELCFTIAEAANRGWVAGGDPVATTWYGKGIDASLSLYGLTQGQVYTVSDYAGTSLGTVTIDIATFKSNVTYLGGTDGLRQILEQKYVAFFQNSGWEPFYNWRRTGIPAFAQGGAGIGTANNNLPRRWQYPLNEKNENATNCNAVIQSQFAGNDDITQDTWLTK